MPVDGDDPLLRAARAWRTVTRYRVERHEKLDDAVKAVAADVARCCPPTSDCPIAFAVAVKGPLLLGRTRHVGGGVFQAVR